MRQFLNTDMRIHDKVLLNWPLIPGSIHPGIHQTLLDPEDLKVITTWVRKVSSRHKY